MMRSGCFWFALVFAVVLLLPGLYLTGRTVYCLLAYQSAAGTANFDARKEGKLGSGKLSRSDVKTILALRRDGVRPHLIAATYGVSPQAIENIRKGRSWWWVSGLPPARKPTPVHPGQLALPFERI